MATRTKDALERVDDWHVCILKRLPVFDQIVQRLAGGSSARSVTVWLQTQNIPEINRLKFWTVLRYVCSLQKRVKPIVQDAQSATANPVQVMRRVEEVISQAEAATPMPARVEHALMDTAELVLHMQESVKEAMSSISAITILKFAYVVQAERVNMRLTMEKKLGMVMPGGDKDIQVLVSLGAEVRKYEIGEEWLGGRERRGGWARGPYPGGLLPHGQTEEKRAPDPFDEFDKLSSVDRNLLRAYTTKVIDMSIRGVTSESASSGVEPAAGGQAAAGPGVAERSSGEAES